MLQKCRYHVRVPPLPWLLERLWHRQGFCSSLLRVNPKILPSAPKRSPVLTRHRGQQSSAPPPRTALWVL